MPLVVDAVDVPVVATGGIMDGRGLAAALALGAQAVQVGHAFLLAEESAAPPHYREALLALRAEDTVVTDHVSGRPARWICNRFVDAMVEGPEPLGWPHQYIAISDLRVATRREPRPDLMPMLAGQAGPCNGGRAGGRHRPPDGGRGGGDPGGARSRRCQAATAAVAAAVGRQRASSPSAVRVTTPRAASSSSTFSAIGRSTSSLPSVQVRATSCVVSPRG